MRLALNAPFALSCFAFALAISGCDGMGPPDATDEYYAGEAAAAAASDAVSTPTDDASDDATAEDEEEAPTEDEQDDALQTDGGEQADEGGDEYASECLFGTNMAEMAGADWLAVGDFEHVTGAEALNDLEAEQLLAGFAEHGAGVADGIDDLFERFVDEERLMARSVIDLDTDEVYTHLAFWSAGREQGYVFLANTLRLVAAVDAGTIYACVVAL